MLGEKTLSLWPDDQNGPLPEDRRPNAEKIIERLHNLPPITPEEQEEKERRQRAYFEAVNNLPPGKRNATSEEAEAISKRISAQISNPNRLREIVEPETTNDKNEYTSAWDELNSPSATQFFKRKRG